MTTHNTKGTNMFDNLEGVWIPKEILLNQELSLQERFLLSAIKNLSGDGECFASNPYFAELLGLSKKRVEGLIKRLDDAGYIKRRFTYREGSKQIERRFIRLTIPPLKSEDTPAPKSEGTPPQKRGRYSKEDNKELNNKDYSTHTEQAQNEYDFSESDLKPIRTKLFINDLDTNEYWYCYRAMEALKDMKLNEGMSNIYLGSQSEETWYSCELKLEEIANTDEAINHFTDKAEAIRTLLWTIYTKRSMAVREGEIGLPFLIDPENKSMDTGYMVGVDYMDFLNLSESY